MKRPRNLPMPNLAYQDPAFMQSLAARPLRILAEYFDPMIRLRRANVGDTIVMFGSARIQAARPGARGVEAGPATGRRPPDARMAAQSAARPARS